MKHAPSASRELNDKRRGLSLSRGFDRKETRSWAEARLAVTQGFKMLRRRDAQKNILNKKSHGRGEKKGRAHSRRLVNLGLASRKRNKKAELPTQGESDPGPPFTLTFILMGKLK